MLRALDISGVVPSKIFLPDNLRNHGRDPSLVLERFESYILRSLDGFVPGVISF
jgi:hypothetical protein